jgi:hypothetical protein
MDLHAGLGKKKKKDLHCHSTMIKNSISLILDIIPLPAISTFPPPNNNDPSAEKSHAG